MTKKEQKRKVWPTEGTAGGGDWEKRWGEKYYKIKQVNKERGKEKKGGKGRGRVEGSIDGDP